MADSIREDINTFNSQAQFLYHRDGVWPNLVLNSVTYAVTHCEHEGGNIRMHFSKENADNWVRITPEELTAFAQKLTVL